MKKIIIIAGPTGVGESTITKALIKLIPNSERFITTTSRPIRGAEKDGVDYFYISKTEFEERIKLGHFLEYTYVRNRDNYYGTPIDQVKVQLAKGKTLFFNYDYVGVEALRAKMPGKTIALFIEPVDLGQIRHQLLMRDPNFATEELEQRLRNAAEEILTKNKYDHIVVNHPNKLDQTIKDCLSLIGK